MASMRSVFVRLLHHCQTMNNNLVNIITALELVKKQEKETQKILKQILAAIQAQNQE